jgi:hypothetical protein
MAAPDANAGSHQPPGNGSGGGWRAFLGLSLPNFCWEFLRRNPVYREHYSDVSHGLRPLESRWGLAIPADPDRPAEQAPALWRADAAPGLVVPMERHSFGPQKALPKVVRECVAEEGRHLRLESGLQLLLRDNAEANGPLVIVLAYDADFHLRVRAVDALRRANLTDAPPPSRLNAAQRERLARCLFALDASLNDWTHRQIAGHLFSPEAADGPAFATSSVRDVTARLVRRGRALMTGGYLRLLRAGF